MLARTFAPAVIGIDSHLITIECDITNGLPGFIVVGLGDKAVDESRERVKSAVKNSGLMLPAKRITLNLAPADLPKDGSGYDLGLAVAVLVASGQIDPSLVENSLFIGELALDGSIRAIKGALIGAQAARDNQIERVFVPAENAPEAASIAGCKVFGVTNLIELYQHLTGHHVLPVTKSPGLSHPSPQTEPPVDLANIYGQAIAKRAVEIAAAGGHNILLSGPPGTGKTLLAKSMMGLLPAPSLQESIEISKLHAMSDRGAIGLVGTRPFRAPHHSASSTALIGGGTKPRPGEISLSHGGVLFLDELPEFPRSVLEVLRQPLEDGHITIARAAGVITFPADFMLVATRNPCPCGYFSDPSGKCHCNQASISRYQHKVSGPLLDRIDLVTEVSRIDNDAIINGTKGEASRVVAKRVQRARDIQTARFVQTDTSTNAKMSTKGIAKHCKIDNEIAKIAGAAMKSLDLSARGYSRTLKVARTIADLDGSQHIRLEHFTEALQYRPRLPAASSKP